MFFKDANDTEREQGCKVGQNILIILSMDEVLLKSPNYYLVGVFK
jgi:hypothetical protein